MPRYLVTGGCGFIGSHLVKALIDSGATVRVLDDLSSGDAGRCSDRADLRIDTICNADAVADAMEDVDGVFHLAAIASVEHCNREWVQSHQVNLGGTLNVLLAACRPLRRIPVVFASSAAVYGHQDVLPIIESAHPMPTSAYGADKLGGEHHAASMSLASGLVAVGLRFFNVFGEGQDPRSPYSGVISIFSDRLGSGLPVTIFGDGAATRDFVSVRDIVLALQAGMVEATRIAESEAAGFFRAFNVCTGKATSVLSLAGLVAEIIGSPLLIQHAPARTGEIRHSLGDPSALRAWIRLPSQLPLEQGLHEVLRAARA